MATRSASNAASSGRSLGKLDGLGDLSGLKNLELDAGALRNLDLDAGALRNLDAGALRKADDVADAGSTAARRADDASNAKKAEKADDASNAKKAEKLDTATVVVGTALVAGSLLYLDDKIADEEKEIKACVGTCLPSNWDDYEYGNLQKEELTYQTVDTIKAEFPDEEVDPKQPFCKEGIEECGDFCLDKCRDVHESSLPGGELLGRGVRKVKETADDAADTFLGPLKDMFSSIGASVRTPFSIAAVLVILLAIWYIFFK